MKYHVNPETGKVSPCRAKLRCRFGGSSGNENHYGSRNDALTASEKLMGEKYGNDHQGTSSFDATKENIIRGLVDSGIVANRNSLPTVRTEAEMIKLWFNGDKKKYELMARITAPSSPMKPTTKKSVGKLVGSGFDVSLGSGDDFKKPQHGLSDVELLDEEIDGLDLEALKAGSLKPF